MIPKLKFGLYKIFNYLSLRRKRQFFFIIILIIVSGFFEAFSVASAIPFLALLSSPDKIFDIYLVKVLAEFFDIHNPIDLFLPSALFFGAFVLFSTATRLLNVWFIAYFIAKIEIDLSRKLFEKNLYQTYSAFTKRNSSEIISLLISKISLCCAAISAFIRSISSIVISFSIITSLIIINWKVSLYILFFIVIYYLLISNSIKKFLRKNSYIEANLDTSSVKIVQEAFGGFRDITMNRTQQIYLNNYVDMRKKIRFFNVRSNLFSQFPRYLLEAFILITIITVAYFQTISGNDLSFLTLLGTYAFGAQKLLPVIQQMYVGWTVYQSKCANIKFVLVELEKNDLRKNIRLNKNINIENFDFLSFQDVSYSYKNRKNSKYILNNVNLTIKKGEYIGIYGETGSGKSTFVDLLMGLLEANEGKILFNDINLYQKNNLASWRDLIAHVPQDIYLKEGTIQENIVFNSSDYQVNYDLLVKYAKMANIYEFIENLEFGFQTIVGERGIRLSGGQKQRISIARALYRNKKILVLDEATSALDEETEQAVINSILNNTRGITIVMITHRKRNLANCSRVFKVINGSIIEKY